MTTAATALNTPLAPYSNTVAVRATADLVAHLHGRRQGLSLLELQTEMATRMDARTLEAALANAIGTGQIRYRFDDEVEQLSKLKFFAADVVKRAPVSDGVVQAVIAYIESQEDFGRLGGPGICIAPLAVRDALAHKYADEQILAALDVLRSEALLHFIARCSNGYVSETLPEHRRFTVLAYDGQNRQSLCFHVRAGNRDVALKKVKDWAGLRASLTIFGLAQGWLSFESADGQKPLRVAQL